MRDHIWFEKFCRDHQLKPLVKVEDPMADILIADGGVFTDRKDEYPSGYYQTAWGLQRDKMSIATWLEFEANHDEGWSLRAKQEGRVNAALAKAREFISKAREVDLYG